MISSFFFSTFLLFLGTQARNPYKDTYHIVKNSSTLSNDWIDRMMHMRNRTFSDAQWKELWQKASREAKDWYLKNPRLSTKQGICGRMNISLFLNLNN